VGQGGRKGEEERGHHLQHGVYLYLQLVEALPEREFEPLFNASIKTQPP
jgi:hypothetical protein